MGGYAFHNGSDVDAAAILHLMDPASWAKLYLVKRYLERYAVVVWLGQGWPGIGLWGQGDSGACRDAGGGVHPCEGAIQQFLGGGHSFPASTS